MFTKKINNKTYIVGEPTLRQNKALIKYCADKNINFIETSEGIDFGRILLSAAKGNHIEDLLSIMIHEDGKIWSEGCNSSILDELPDLTETEIEEIVKEFFLKKKEWINGLMNILQSYFLRLLLNLTKAKTTSK